MTLKDKMKTYNFWISLVSAVLLIVRILGDTYGFSVDAGLVMDLTTGVCGIFVILGIISVPQKNEINKINKVENMDQKVVSYNNMFQDLSEKVQIDSNVVSKIENIIEIEENIVDDLMCGNDIIVSDSQDEVVDSTSDEDVASEQITENIEDNTGDKLLEFLNTLSLEEVEKLKKLL